MPTADVAPRIEIVQHPHAQQAAVLGMRDLLSVAGRLYAARPIDVVIRTQPAAPERRPDVIVLPPCLGEGAPPAMPAEWRDWLLARHAEGVLLCSVCVGAFWLGALGVLDGRPATTHWALGEDFQARFPKVQLDVDRLLVDDGDIITAGGMMAWIDVGLHLIARYLGPTAMVSTARHFLVDPGGREQRFYRTFAPVTTHGDAEILRAQRWLQARLGHRVSVSAAASAVGLTERTFNRRFQKATGMRATAYLQHLRVHRARELLEHTAMNQQEVAWEVGYEDPGAFRRVFERLMGLSPGAYRRRFRSPSPVRPR